MSHTTKAFVPYQKLELNPVEMVQRSQSYYEFLDQRRSVRMFSDQAVDRKVIENIVMAASSAPSGAHKQPWTFCIVENSEIKSAIREAAEKEEYLNYNGRMSEEWLEDLKPFDTNWHKPFLEIAPYLIILFKKAYDIDEHGQKHKNYYVNESVGIAAGF